MISTQKINTDWEVESLEYVPDSCEWFKRRMVWITDEFHNIDCTVSSPIYPFSAVTKTLQSLTPLAGKLVCTIIIVSSHNSLDCCSRMTMFFSAVSVPSYQDTKNTQAQMTQTLSIFVRKLNEERKSFFFFFFSVG